MANIVYLKIKLLYLQLKTAKKKILINNPFFGLLGGFHRKGLLFLIVIGIL